MKIRIDFVSPGNVPAEIRAEWLGIELPVDENLQKNADLAFTFSDADTLDVYGEKKGYFDPNADDYVVTFSNTMAALWSADKEKVAKKWEEI